MQCYAMALLMLLAQHVRNSGDPLAWCSARSALLQQPTC